MIACEHVALQVADPAALAQWYRQHLGFAVVRRFDDEAAAHFIVDGGGRVILEVYRNPRFAVPDYAAMPPQLLHIAYAVADVVGVRDALMAAGAVLVDDLFTSPTGDELVMLRDPWGLAVQLVKRAVPMLA